MDNFCPICLPEAGKPMFGDTGVADTVDFEQLAIDKRIFGVDMKNA